MKREKDRAFEGGVPKMLSPTNLSYGTTDFISL